MNNNTSKYSCHLFDRSYDMNLYNHSQLTIWVLYHNENQINQYHLVEDDHTYIFNTSNTGYLETNINQLNKLFCEGVGILYPYFNHLKSDIIGFQLYRRPFRSSLNDLQLDNIYDHKIQVFQDRLNTNLYESIYSKETYQNLANQFYMWKIYNNGFYDDAVEFFQKYFPEYLETEKHIHNMHGRSSFVCLWDEYIKLCDMLWGYIQFIANKYHFDVYSEYDWVNFIYEHFILFNQQHHIPPSYFPWTIEPYGYNNWECLDYDNDLYAFIYYRIFSFNVEFFVSMFAHHKGYIFDINNVVD